MLFGRKKTTGDIAKEQQPKHRPCWDEKTQASFALPSEAVANCVPGAQRVIMQNVNHNGPVRDPDAFSAAVLEFLAKRQGF